MKKNTTHKLIIMVIILVIIGTFGVFHRSIIQYVWESKVNFEQQQENERLNDTNIIGVGSCTTREECEEKLGKGAFCSYEKCFPAPEDYVEGVAECMCPDGTKIRTIDCRWIDCPGTPTISTEFTIKNGLVSKATVDINLPLSGKEAKEVAIAACGVSTETSEPSSPYENIISECSPTWNFLDETNPCNNTEAHVCANDTVASCIFGGETTGAFCINGLHIIQEEYDEKFIVANPLDLSQAEKFSRFRSCLGHDYSGYNDKGELETQRSMKQGALPLPSVTKMNIYAPFDGIIIRYFTTTSEDDPIEEHEIEILGNHSDKWFITFAHFTLKEGLKVGSTVTAGELIGTSTINAAYKGPEVGLNQDISTETVKEQFVRGSLLDYMSNDVLAEYASYGLTPENVVYTKEYRDAHPCNWEAVGSDPNDFVILNSK